MTCGITFKIIPTFQSAWLVFLQYNIDLEVFPHTDIQYGPLIGQGGEATVHSCTITYNGVPVHAAAKTVLDNSDDAISITLDELELLW